MSKFLKNWYDAARNIHFSITKPYLILCDNPVLKMFISVLWKLRQGTDTLFQASDSVINFLRFFTNLLTIGTTCKYTVSMVMTRLVMTTLEMVQFGCCSYPSASEASREVAKLTWRKIHTHQLWCQRICLSVCLSVAKFDLNYLRTDKMEWAETFWGIFLTHFAPFSTVEYVTNS